MFSGDSESVRACVYACVPHTFKGHSTISQQFNRFLTLHPICERKTVLLSNVSFYSQVPVWRGALTYAISHGL